MRISYMRVGNKIFATAVLSIAFGAAASNNGTEDPGDRYVQTGPGIYVLFTDIYYPGLYCDQGLNPCSFQVPAGDNYVYGTQISLQIALANDFIPDDNGIYDLPLVHVVD